MIKITIKVKQVSDPDDGDHWEAPFCSVKTGANTSQLLSSTERYKTKDEAIEDMKRRARNELDKRNLYTGEEEINWAIREDDWG